MKMNWKKGTSLLLATAATVSMTVNPAMAAEEEFMPYSTEVGTSRAAEMEPPASVTASADENGFLLDFGYMNGTWAGKITKITIDGEEWEKVNLKFYMAEKTFMVRASDGQIVIGEGFANDTATCVISATGYKDLTLTLDKTNHSAVIVEEDNEEKDDTPAVDKKVELSQIAISENSSFGSLEWSVTVEDAEDFVSGIQSVTVNDTAWKTTTYLANGGQYKISDGKLLFAKIAWSSSGTPVLANGDIIKITSTGYQDVTFKFVIDADGNATAEPVGSSSEKPDTPKEKEITLNQLEVTEDSWSNAWSIAVKDDADFVSGIQSVTVNDTAWNKTPSLANGGQYKISDGKLLFAKTTWSSSGTPVLASGDIITITADGYKPLTFKFIIDKDGNATAEPVGSSEKPDTPKEKEITLNQLEAAEDSVSNAWSIAVKDDANYISSITEIKVNDAAWENVIYLANGGQYKINDGKVLFAQSSFGSTPALKSGDVITITADGYKPLTFKFIIDKDGNATVEENDGKGDTLALHVKIEGNFEAAIVGQKNYDSVGGASTGGGASSKNSSVTVYGALVEKETGLVETDWEELNHQSKIDLSGKDCFVTIVPDTENGTAADSDSGMTGVYAPYSSALELSGTPKDAGKYLISVTIQDDQGRTATSNSLPFRIYTGEETLAEQIAVENLKQYTSGLYAWDIMEPWAIKNFGSNVAGEENSVRVPKDLEAWFGSHTSGTYGYLGYDIAWADVVAGKIPQTLYIPDGCHLTLTNMQVLSSVRIVVENGGKLTLSDSVVQGIIEVKNGGTFSMNYDSYAKEFTTGASLCGQLRLESGATLENAAIYSHTNYLANGDLTDRSNDAAVVLATGDVNIRGQVFIQGDEAGSTGVGQTALEVKNGTLHMDEAAVLAAYGGGGNTTLYSNGGTAILLDNGNIDGNFKVAAIGGSVTFGNGGHAVSGNGNITVTEAFLQGATAYTAKDATAGKAINGTVNVSVMAQHIKDGEVQETGTTDKLAELYWKKGIETTPPLEKFVTEAVSNGPANGPDNSTPDNSTPDNSTPDNSTPDNSTPDNSTPDNSTPDNSTPDNSTPDNSTPEKPAPENPTPEKPAPEKPATSTSSSHSSKKYTVAIEDSKHGAVKANSTRVKKDATVTLTVTPEEGYELDTLTVLNQNDEKITVKEKDGKYTFTMPRGNVTVEADFTKTAAKEPVTETTQTPAQTEEQQEIRLTVGQKAAWVRDGYVINDAAPEIVNGRTMLPIRFIVEELGGTVTWNADTKTVSIVKDDVQIELYIGQSFAKVNGNPVQLDAPAYIANGRTYLPLRFVAENLGATVTWNADTKEVILK